MRRANALITSALVLAFLVPVAALAADKNSAKIDFPTAVTLGSNNLKPGTYTVQWTDAGKVTLLSGKKEIATVDGTVTNSGVKGDFNAMLVTDGKLTGVRLKDGRTVKFSSEPQEAAPAPARR